ncbi:MULTISPECIES: dihydrolipoamide dehydrogenase [unclassified Jeotgalibaca]|uniref:dihydrolipoamide dehydrogenase n=1 Tax=unclassified Jeotgalibaca TaxID=2621505 RepID=UPI003FCF29FD
MGQLPTKWTGLPPARFMKYKGWINRNKPGICGTYCASVLLHDAIYQKTKKSLPKQVLLDGMKAVVDDLLPYRGTFFWDLAHGLRRMLSHTKIWHVRMGILNERIIPRILGSDNPRPVIVGTTKYLNSNYNNHWLVVYGYGYNEKGKLYFRGYDNHGRYKAIVPASQTICCVWLDERE